MNEVTSNFSWLRVRNILRVGSIVFGMSSLMLTFLPSTFIELLGLSSASPALEWAMRMIGITLVALSGNMWMNSYNPNDSAVVHVAQVMSVAATALGVVTLLIPTDLNWFSILYAIVGIGFGTAYLGALLRQQM